MPSPAPDTPDSPSAGWWLVGSLAGLVLGLLLMAALSIEILSGTRASVAGGSSWAQGQKSATIALLHYVQDGDENQWEAFEAALAVPQGYRQARLALQRTPRDVAAAQAGFLQGGVHPDDIDTMVRLFGLFHRLPVVARSLAVWSEGDQLIEELEALARALRRELPAGANAAEREVWAERLLALDARITPLERRFSETLGEAARRVRLLLWGAMLLASLVMTGLAGLGARRALRRERAQSDQLRASRARRDRAIQGSSDGFFEWDLESQAAFYSPRFEALLGLPLGALGQAVSSGLALLHPDDQPPAQAALRHHLQTGQAFDVLVRMRHQDGRWRWMRARAQGDPGEGHRVRRLSGSIQDVTEQRDMQEALRQREAMFRSLWETTTDAVLMIDRRHQIRFANPAAHAHFGHAPGALVGQPLAVLQPERMQAGHRMAADRYVASGQRRLDWRSTEVVARHAEGHEIPMEISFSELVMDGEPLFVGFLRDISARKQAERALQEANQGLEARVAARTLELSHANERLRELDRLKSEFMAMVSHELRTPLNSILGFTDLLRRGASGPLSDRQLRQIQHVHDSGQHLLSLITDVLDLTSIESGRMELHPEWVDFAELAQAVRSQLQPLADQRGLQLVLQLAPDLRLWADRRKLYQVLLNLVGNGIKFTTQGEVRIEAEADDAQLRVRVRDSGVGISPEGLAQLFQPFHQLDRSLDRAHDGTGLGLYLCRKLLGLMGGGIRAESTLGAGSCFHLDLPRAPQVQQVDGQ